jgi:hypothetical protein
VGHVPTLVVDVPVGAPPSPGEGVGPLPVARADRAQAHGAAGGAVR